MNEPMTGDCDTVTPRKRTVDEIKRDINRIAVLERQNVRRAVQTAQAKAEIHDIKSGLGVA